MRQHPITICLFIMLIIAAMPASSQTLLADSLQIDSLRKVLSKNQEDSSRVNNLNLLVRVLRKSKRFEEAI